MRRLFSVLAVLASALVSSTPGNSHTSQAYLEQYDLSQLTYMRKGSVDCEGGEVAEAIVFDPKGFFHRVRVDQEISKHFGMVEEIHSDRMLVFEILGNEKGEWEARKVVMHSQDVYGFPAPAHIYEEYVPSDRSANRERREPALAEQLTGCATGHADDAKRLACYDKLFGQL